MPKLYSKNAKKHPDKQLKQIASSLKEFGWQQPIVVDKNDEIIVGHGRWMAYQKYPEGIKEPWIVKADNLTPQQVKAYRLADNKLNESDWDMELAIEELKELDSELFDLTGFDKDLLIEPDEKDDVIPENAPSLAQLGDIWQLGRHRVMCGDSTDPEAVQRLMEGKKADMVFTDPPYNVAYEGMQNSKQWSPIANDKMSDKEFEEFLTRIFENYNSNTKQDGAFYICHSDKASREFINVFESVGLEWRATIIWVKNSSAFNFAQYKYQHEPIFYCFRKGNTVNWYGDLTNTTTWYETWDDQKILKWVKKQKEKEKQNGETTVWNAKKEHGNHPTIKPIELITKALHNSSKQDDIVLELFLGSGSTLIACEKTNRICYGMELDPKYCDVIIKRYEDYTGNKAEKIQ